METQIKQFILRALLNAQDMPMTDETLRRVTRNAFRHVVITCETLDACLVELKAGVLIDCRVDEVSGKTWMLTEKGIFRAEKIA